MTSHSGWNNRSSAAETTKSDGPQPQRQCRQCALHSRGDRQVMWRKVVQCATAASLHPTGFVYWSAAPSPPRSLRAAAAAAAAAAARRHDRACAGCLGGAARTGSDRVGSGRGVRSVDALRRCPSLAGGLVGRSGGGTRSSTCCATHPAARDSGGRGRMKLLVAADPDRRVGQQGRPGQACHRSLAGSRVHALTPPILGTRRRSWLVLRSGRADYTRPCPPPPPPRLRRRRRLRRRARWPVA